MFGFIIRNKKTGNIDLDQGIWIQDLVCRSLGEGGYRMPDDKKGSGYRIPDAG